MTYDKIDELIVSAIEQQRPPLYASAVCEEARRLSRVIGREDFRIIDGRLSALKAAKRIVWRTKKEAATTGMPSGWNLIWGSSK